MASSFVCQTSAHSLNNSFRLGFTNDNDSREASRYTKPRQTYSSDQVLSYLTVESGAYQPMQLPAQSLVGHKRLPGMGSLEDTVMHHAEEYTMESAPTTTRKMKVSASRRERCRINQARYRKRQRQHEEELNKSIFELQEKIQELQTQHQDMMRSAPQNESMWVVATEYFRLFRYGYMTPMATAKSSSDEKPSPLPVKQAQVQLDYLQTYMTPDVVDGTVSGAEALLEKWKFISLHHDDVYFQLKRLEQVGKESLVAVTSTSATITEKTLRHVYPHLVGERSPLATKLLNQRLIMCGSVRFDWDASCGRMMRVESKVDMLTPMLKLLGSLDDVAYVFNNALLTLDGRIVSN
ncbi:hypothetical protein L916_01749 [Phytophthora nicotianae]|uniref:BZIP domain-containing protein n=1 Tax=Phytophthora nicotianae TaxID=4792 RepID=W2JSN6_PHYNI|nr:hypothetical protein L916_01749 [Phytophthora nicotianae]